MELQLLGPVRLIRGGRAVGVGTRKQRFVLAVLALQPNHLVTVDRLIDLLWPDQPPPTARGIIHGHVSGLRTVLAADTTANEWSLRREGSGYLLACDPLVIDVHHFIHLVNRATTEPHPGHRLEILDRALRLWRGPALADIAPEHIRAVLARHLDETRLTATEHRLTALLDLGRHDEALPELTRLAGDQPDWHRITELLMTALHRTGRTADALTIYRQTKHRLADEQGLDPPAHLRQLELSILRDELAPSAYADVAPSGPRLTDSGESQDVSTMAFADGYSDGPIEPGEVAATAWRLPTPLPDFVGRATERKVIDECLTKALEAGGAPIAAISGLPGIGKTALAVTAAYALRDRFPAGQLFADLHGHDSPGDPGRILARFLRELGVPGQDVPEDEEEAVALYRTLLSQQPRIVLLDNAAAVHQIRPLFPPPACPLLVTSRHALADLDGALFIRLGPWQAAESLRLLAGVLGGVWSVEDDEAAAKIVERCGHLPLAIRIVAAQCQTGGLTLAGMAETLSLDSGRLDQLYGDGRSVRASLLSAYASLADRERELLRGLAVTTSDAFPGWVANAIVDSDASGQLILRRLVQASLVDADGVDALGQSRFRLHDLVRAFAAEQDGPEDVLLRVVDAWNTLADEADTELVLEGTYRVNPANPMRPAYTDRHRADPQGWFAVEISTLLDVADRAASAGLDFHAWSLIWNTESYLRADARPRDIIALSRRGLGHAERAADQRGIACMGLSLAAAHLIVDEFTEAEQHCSAALAAAEACADAWLQAEILRVLSQVHESFGRTPAQREALTRAAALYEKSGDVASLGATKVQLANVAALTGDHATAAAYFEHGVNALRQAGSANLLARGLRRYAISRRDAGDLEGCVELLRECLALIGRAEPTGQLCVRTELGMALAELGRLAEARTEADHALSLVDRVDLPLYTAYAQMGDGVVLAYAGRSAEAVDILSAAIPVLKGAPLWRLTGLTHLGRLQAILGQPDLARSTLVAVAAEATEMQVVAVAERARTLLETL